MSKDSRVAFRLPSAEKELLEAAAKQDGMSLSAWLRWLGERRAGEQQLEAAGKVQPLLTPPRKHVDGCLLDTDHDGPCQTGSSFLDEPPAAEPAPVGFIPGFGLEEE